MTKDDYGKQSVTFFFPECRRQECYGSTGSRGRSRLRRVANLRGRKGTTVVAQWLAASGDPVASCGIFA